MIKKTFYGYLFFCFILAGMVTKNASAQEQKLQKQKIEYLQHTIEEGDNLYLLSSYYFNNARLWKKIYEINKDKIKNPNVLKNGLIIDIPLDKKKWKPKFSLNAWRALQKK